MKNRYPNPEISIVGGVILLVMSIVLAASVADRWPEYAICWFTAGVGACLILAGYGSVEE